jgi:hypothetical protein
MRRLLWKQIAGAVAAVCATAAQADDGFGSIGGALGEIRPLVDTRLRFEGVDQDPMADEAEALTLRARLGFETGKAWDTSLLVEGEFIWPLRSDYNSTINGKTGYPAVPDPESHEINRLQLTNTSISGTTLTVGRQRIVLDDHRFVGNVGWRQNEQTFDSVRVVNRSVPNLTIDVAYLDQVNRVFGKNSPQGRYYGDSVLGNVAYQFPIGKLTAFGYWLEFDPLPGVPAAVRDSSKTFGLRFAGERSMNRVKLGYIASYAQQEEHGANPLSFRNDYRLLELTATYRQYSLGVGAEILEGDGVKGFTTPLATLHKFQGWADKFLATPADGIEDRYVNAGFTLKGVGALDTLGVLASYHVYDAERTSQDYGSEYDAQVQAKWKRTLATLKFGSYRADTLFTDTTKLWLQLEYVW